MKLVKSSQWFRLRGQSALNTKETAKVDTLVSDQERVFFIPETLAEKEFFKVDQMLYLSGVPLGPVSADAGGQWGWRMENNITEKDMLSFSKWVEEMYDNVQKTLKNKTPNTPAIKEKIFN